MTYRGSKVAVLLATFNEETQIERVLGTMPTFVDHIVVVDDASTDNTVERVQSASSEDLRITLIALDENVGVGGALAHAYRWVAESPGIDLAVSIDGDGQMDPDEMHRLLDPLVDGVADYAKGNRLADTTEWRKIPRIRLMGNAILSLLTKMASGYWSVADSQSGYSAANRYALDHIDWDDMYARYGRPNDVLVLANMAECRVADVPISAVYGVGERSSMRIARVTVTISALLVRRFWWRLFQKYLLRDFHPLLFFYLLATVTMAVSIGLGVRLVYLWSVNGFVPELTALALAFLVITSLNSSFFAFWMDMQANAHLAVKLVSRGRHDPEQVEHDVA